MTPTKSAKKHTRKPYTTPSVAMSYLLINFTRTYIPEFQIVFGINSPLKNRPSIVHLINRNGVTVGVEFNSQTISFNVFLYFKYVFKNIIPQIMINQGEINLKSANGVSNKKAVKKSTPSLFQSPGVK